MAAGQAEGIELWDMQAENHESVPTDTYLPTTTDEGRLIVIIKFISIKSFKYISERDLRYNKWKMAVQRSLGWATTKKSIAMTDERYRLLASIPASIFLISSFGLLLLSEALKR